MLVQVELEKRAATLVKTHSEWMASHEKRAQEHDEWMKHMEDKLAALPDILMRRNGAPYVYSQPTLDG